MVCLVWSVLDSLWGCSVASSCCPVLNSQGALLRQGTGGNAFCPLLSTVTRSQSSVYGWALEDRTPSTGALYSWSRSIEPTVIFQRTKWTTITPAGFGALPAIFLFAVLLCKVRWIRGWNICDLQPWADRRCSWERSKPVTFKWRRRL